MSATITTEIPLSLYIHLPWCVRKCPYCDFNSHALKGNLPEDAYINALIADLEQDLSKVKGRQLSSIFMGGGTPSLFSPTALTKLLAAVGERISMVNNIEITMEANPGTVEQDKFAGFHHAGINRLSIGIQSFQDDKLKNLGRIHDSQGAVTAVATAKKAGFTNFNIDLMYGLPNQSIDDALFDLKTAIALEPTHLSWYQLTLEPNTLFYHQPPTLPSDDSICDIQTHGQSFLKDHGLQQYEISAYSKHNFQCRHNLNYWQFGDYLGIGAGAHGKITDIGKQSIMRYWKNKHPKDYLQGQTFVAEEKYLTANDLPLEFMMNLARLNKEISLDLFEQRCYLPIKTLLPALEKAKHRQLILLNDTTLILTEYGRRYLNDFLELFLP